MKTNNDDAANEAANDEVWPRKLNKILIGVGILAFGAIIADRVISMYSADDIPDTVEIVRENKPTDVAVTQPADPAIVFEDSVVAEADNAQLMEDAIVTVDASAQSEDPAIVVDDSVVDDPVVADAGNVQAMEDAIEIEDVFGSRLLFVSASEPMYVVTGDERRIDIGGEIDDQTTLAGITSQRVILEKDGNLLVISLPEPAAD